MGHHARPWRGELIAAPFLVLGLPRSRTAWCAAFFNGDNVSCQHDGLRYSETVAGLLRDLRGVEKAHAGDSDSGLLFHWRDVERAGVPVMFVHRKFDEVAGSLTRLGLADSIPTLFDVYLEARAMRSRHVLHVPFEGLDEEPTMRVAWKHLCPAALWEPDRFRLFRGLRIEVDLAKYSVGAER